MFNVNGCVCLSSSMWIWNVHAVSACEMYWRDGIWNKAYVAVVRWTAWRLDATPAGGGWRNRPNFENINNFCRKHYILLYTVYLLPMSHVCVSACVYVFSMRVIAICIGLWIDWQVAAIKPCIVAYILQALVLDQSKYTSGVKKINIAGGK